MVSEIIKVDCILVINDRINYLRHKLLQAREIFESLTGTEPATI